MIDRMDQFETDVLAMLLAGDDEVLAALRHQLEVSKRERREYTVVGFFTYYAIPSNFVLLGSPSFVIYDVWATFPGLESPVALQLFISEGFIHMLEGVTCEGYWPASIAEYSLFYSDGAVRNLAKLRAMPEWPKGLG